LRRVIVLLLCVVLGILLGASVVFAAAEISGSDIMDRPSDESPLVSPVLPDTQASNEEIVSLAMEIVGYIKQRNYGMLSQYVHPALGVTFTPYTTINFTADKNFTPAEVKAFGENETVYIWGITDGSGEPIEMTVEQYFTRYVFNADYTIAPIIAVDHTVRTGNALDNIADIMPAARYVEFYYPSIDPSAEGMDWCTLRLGFEEYSGTWRLTLILHSEATV